MSLDQSSRVEIDKAVSLMTDSMVTEAIVASHSQRPRLNSASDGQLGLAERAFSAAGAAFLSAILVNPLDVAKVFFLSLAPLIIFSLVRLCCFVNFLFHL